MGRTGITYFDVSNAIASIQGEQKKPTVDNIRQALGTGSRSTISKYFQEWKTKNEASNTTSKGIPNELQNLIESLWEKIQSDAEQVIETHRIQTDETIKNTKNELSQTQAQNTLLTTEISALTKQLNKQTNAIEKLTENQHQAEKEKTTYIERITSLETQNIKHEAENARLHQLIKNAQNNLTHYQDAVDKQRTALQMQIEKERADSIAILNTVKNELSKITKEKSIIDTKYQLLITEHKTQKDELDACKKEITASQLHSNSLAIRNEHLGTVNENLKKNTDALTQQLKESEEIYHKLNIELAILQNDKNTLEKALRSTEDKIPPMQDELAQLSQENIKLKKQLALSADTIN